MKRTILFTITSLSFACVSNVASAQSDLTLKKLRNECTLIANDLDRLKCYDTMLERKANNLPTTITEKPHVTLSPAVSPKKENVEIVSQSVNDFGAEDLKKVDELEKAYFVLQKVKTNSRRLSSLYFENGQVWKQVESSRLKVRAGDRVYIKRAALGSFLMGKDNLTATSRVKRIK